MKFSGPDLTKRDEARLQTQIEVISSVLADGEWRTLEDIEMATGYRSASISAQLRNLRKPAFGSHTVDRRHVADGLYQYRLGGSR